jgi:hypothetical protein
MKLVMNDKLLTVLLAIVQKRALAISERQMGLIESHSESLREYIKALPTEVVENAGIKRNEFFFRAMDTLCIPPIWLETEPEQLNQFEFGY